MVNHVASKRVSSVDTRRFVNPKNQQKSLRTEWGRQQECTAEFGFVKGFRGVAREIASSSQASASVEILDPAR
jgi:hypothetical protein